MQSLLLQHYGDRVIKDGRGVAWMQKLDDISQAIGELRGLLQGLDRYTHEREHSVNNLSQKVDGLNSTLSGEIAKAKAELGTSFTAALERTNARVQTIDERVEVLEKARERNEGARGLAVWFLQSPVVGWLVALALFIATLWKDQGGGK